MIEVISTIAIVSVFLIVTAILFALGKLMSITHPSGLFGTPWVITIIMFLLPLGYAFFLFSITDYSILGRVLTVLLTINAGLQLMHSRSKAYFFDQQVTLLDRFIGHNFPKGEEITHAKIMKKISATVENISLKDKNTLISMFSECPEIIDFVLKLRKNQIDKSDLVKIHNISKKLIQYRKNHKKDFS